MQIVTDRPQAPTAIRTDLGAIFVSLELSRSTWLITSLSPGGGEKMSKHTVRSGDVAGLWARFSQLKDKVQVRTGQVVPIIVIQEAGLDGFWIHRLLQDEGVESHVVDPASIATSRRRRRAKTDKIDGEALVRALLAYKRGEPRVCAMVRAPTPHEEDRRRICRERKTLTAERVEHVNRIKGLLFAQGISDYEPLLRKRRERLEELRTGDGRPLPEHLKAQIGRELDRLELTLQQIKSVETERNTMLNPSDEGTPAPRSNVNEFEGDWPGIRRCPMVGGFVPKLFQPTAGCLLCRIGADALAERIRRSRTRRLQSRKSAAANNHDPTRLVVGKASAPFDTDPLVSSARTAQWRPSSEGADRCLGAKAVDRLLEICDRRGCAGRSRDNGRLKTNASPFQSSGA